MKIINIRVIIGGVLGGIGFSLVNFLTFGIFGGARVGQTGLLFNPHTQSEKVIAVWKTLSPLPVLIQKPAFILLGWIVFAIAYAFVYQSIAAAWPKTQCGRTWRLALIIWLGTAFFEFMGPFNLLHEPMQVQWIEFVFWILSSTAEAFVIVKFSKA